MQVIASLSTLDRKEHYSVKGTDLRCSFREVLAVLVSEVGLGTE